MFRYLNEILYYKMLKAAIIHFTGQVNNTTNCAQSPSSFTWHKTLSKKWNKFQLECGPMPNVMATLPNIGGALCSTPQSFADAQYYSAVQ